MRKLLFLFALLMSSFYSSAQMDQRDIQQKKISKWLSYNNTVELLKDSIALYTFAFQIEVKKNIDSAEVTSLTVNDTVAHLIFPSYDFLRSVNYAPFITNGKHATIIIPVAVIIANYDSKAVGPRKMRVNHLSDDLYKMFNYNYKSRQNTSKLIYLPPFIISADKAIYD